MGAIYERAAVTGGVSFFLSVGFFFVLCSGFWLFFFVCTSDKETPHSYNT